MLIAERMTHPVHTVRPLDSIRYAREAIETHRVNQLPVVVAGRVIGILTDRDLRDAFPSVFESAAERAWKGARRQLGADPGTIPVEIVMTPHVLTLGPRDTLVDAARIMRRERIGAIPVVDGERLVGIITRADVLQAFIEREGNTDDSVAAVEARRRHASRGAVHAA